MLTRIEAGEGRAILALMAINAASGVANCLVLSAAFALFFQRFAAEQLAIVYVANAGIIVAASALFLQVARRVTIGAALGGMSAALALLAWIGAALLRFSAADWLIFVLPILFQLMFVLGNLVIWNLAGRMFDVRQGRRLFGLVNTGYWIGAVGIGLTVKPMASLLGLAGLLWPAALAASIAAIGIALVTAANRDRIADAKPSGRDVRSPLAAALKDGHALLVFAVTACVWLAFYVIDNIFYERAHAIYADPADLAGFIGLYMAANGIVTIAITAIGSGPLIQALGVPRALLVTPLLLVLLCLAMAATGFTAGEGLLMFILAAATRLVDVAAMGAVNQPALNLTYQPLNANLRTSVQTFAEGIVQPLAIGAAGLLLLWLRQGLGAQSTTLAIVACAVLAAWALCAIGLGKSYRRRFAALLKARAYDAAGEAKLPIDRAAIAVLADAARSGAPAAALYAIETMMEQAPLALLTLLPELARHPSAQVRAAILPHLDAAEPELLREVALRDAVAEIRAAAMTRLAESNGRRQPEVAATLIAPDWPLRRAALLGIAARSGPEDAAFVADQIALLLAGDTASRCAALELIGTAELAGFDDALLRGLGDPDPAIRAAALNACGALRLPGLWPPVAALLGDARSRRPAARALAQGGADAVPALAALAGDPARPPVARQAVCTLLGRVPRAASNDALCALLDDPDPDLRFAALRALARGGATVSDAARIAWLTRELDDATEIAGFAAAVVAGSPIAAALASSLAGVKQRVLLLIGLGHDLSAMVRAMRILVEPDSQTQAERGRAAAFELVEMCAPPALRQRVLELLAAAPAAVDRPAGDVAVELLRSRPRWANDWVIACAAPRAARDSTMEAGMVSVVERVLLLKSSNFFSGVPESLLAGIAGSLTEVPVAAGATIVAEGAIEQAMYVIARGGVEVRHGGAGFARLGEGEVFGELALLDPAPRSATVVALEDSLLLKLDGPVFQDLLADHGEMALAIIRELVQRLRATSARMPA